MWAKSESLQNAGHQMAGALTPPRRRKPEKNRVLRCQLLLCVAAVLGILLLQRLRPESAERFKAESRTMLSSPLMGQQQVVRFAMAAAEKLQQAAQIQPQQAQPVQVLAAGSHLGLWVEKSAAKGFSHRNRPGCRAGHTGVSGTFRLCAGRGPPPQLWQLSAHSARKRRGNAVCTYAVSVCCAGRACAANDLPWHGRANRKCHRPAFTF